MSVAVTIQIDRLADVVGLQPFTSHHHRRPTPTLLPMTSPGWLVKTVTNSEHLMHISAILATREEKRERARDVSRHKDPRFGRKLRLRDSGDTSLPTSQFSEEILQQYSVEIGSRAEHLRRNRYYQIGSFRGTEWILEDFFEHLDTESITNFGRYDQKSGAYILTPSPEFFGTVTLLTC